MKYFIAIILFTLSTYANAVDFQIELGLHDGGDELASVSFTSGSTESINAGGFLSFSVGLVFDHGDYASRFKYGIKNDSIDATNGSIDWDRNVADALLMYKVNNDIQIGAGITHHSNVELSGTGVVSGSVQFDNALGFLLEADYFWDTKSYIGLSFTSIDYKTNNTTVDGNSIGIVVGGIF